MDITVVGTGYVGLVAACCMADAGHFVTAVDTDKQKVKAMQSGIMPIFEQGLEEVFNKVISTGKLSFTWELSSAIKKRELVFIAVGTPAMPSGRADLSQVHNVVEEIVKLAEHPLTVVMKSTVPPGTGKSIQERFLSKSQVPISYVSNPEFLREGKALWDWNHPDRIVIGAEHLEAVNLVKKLYQDIDSPIVCMDITSAEMVKYASNAFLATKISFINEIANLCELVGANIDSVSATVGMDERIGAHFLQAGLGYGGSCFPKDTKGLEYVSAFNGYDFNLLKAVIEVNSRQKILAIRKVLQQVKDISDKKVAILGVAFKPDTDDIREAPALDIIDHLISERAQVRVADPMALEKAKQKYSMVEKIEFFNDPYQACSGCSAVILATEWPEYIQLDWGRILRDMDQHHCILLDGRNALNKKQLEEEGFVYMGIGRT